MILSGALHWYFLQLSMQEEEVKYWHTCLAFMLALSISRSQTPSAEQKNAFLFFHFIQPKKSSKNLYPRPGIREEKSCFNFRQNLHYFTILRNDQIEKSNIQSNIIRDPSEFDCIGSIDDYINSKLWLKPQLAFNYQLQPLCVSIPCKHWLHS